MRDRLLSPKDSPGPGLIPRFLLWCSGLGVLGTSPLALVAGGVVGVFGFIDPTSLLVLQLEALLECGGLTSYYQPYSYP